MRKIDLHIHTIQSVSDVPFSFSLTVLQNYISECNIDCIAITNHNLFDLKQYNLIKENVSIPVFPGIEIDLDGGHILLITDINDDLSDFQAKCNVVKGKINTKDDFIEMDEFQKIFPNLDKYILIPHYKKNPNLKAQDIERLKSFISAGEVDSPKKFIQCQINTRELVPVYFSDIRIKESLTDFSFRQTYFDINEDITFSSIRYCLKDKTKVSLNQNAEKKLFEFSNSKLKLISGLNVVLGKRSTGKTHLLEEIFANYQDALYIKQFSLLQDAGEENRFENLLSENQNSVFDAEMAEFQAVVNDVKNVDMKKNEAICCNYLEKLKAYAQETGIQDVFSKTKLYTETQFPLSDFCHLQDLIKAVETLFTSNLYNEIIEKYVSKDNLRLLYLELIKQYRLESYRNSKYKWVNDIVNSIKKDLCNKSSSVHIPDINFTKIYLDSKRKQKFEQIAKSICIEKIIEKRNLYGFTIQAKRLPFLSASEIRSYLKRAGSIQDAFLHYNLPYEYLQELKRKEDIQSNDYYRFFVKINYEVLNKTGGKVSGGERSEFNLLNELNTANNYDLLLIDEPESSFDNIFLRDSVNSLLKDLSAKTPVVLVTHNNTIGISVKPDYILYTEKIIENKTPIYKVYSGEPSSKELRTQSGEKLLTRDILLDCLEAGENTYIDRGRTYEILKN